LTVLDVLHSLWGMPPPPKKVTAKGPPKVFLVHGQNEAAHDKVARVLEKIGCDLVILHEQANKGQNLFQKFEGHSAVAFAVVLLTADDQGGPVGTSIPKQRKRARQNVILELGFFLAKLGEERVCCLYEEGVELPSDVLGRLYVPFGKDDKWKLELARELRSVGIAVDSNQLL
jgi:predicted nucleotide-binding protein